MYYIYIKDDKIILSSTEKQNIQYDKEFIVNEWWHYIYKNEELLKINILSKLQGNEFFVWIIDYNLINKLDEEREQNKIKAEALLNNK